MNKLLRKTGRLIIALALVLLALSVMLNGSAPGVTSAFADDSQTQEEGLLQEDPSPDSSVTDVEGASGETQISLTETVSDGEVQTDAAVPVEDGEDQTDTPVSVEAEEPQTDPVEVEETQTDAVEPVEDPESQR